MKKYRSIKISKNMILIFDQFGESFALGITIIPTLVVNLRKGYYQFTFCWIKTCYDFTFFNPNK